MRIISNDRGQAMVETAIVLPLLLFLLVVILEVCLLANARALVRYSAFCAARSASVYGEGEHDRLKTSAVIPLLSLERPLREKDGGEALLKQSQVPLGVAKGLQGFFRPGGMFAPAKPLAFNRSIESSVASVWRKTFVTSRMENGIAEAEVCYFYRPFFPVSLFAGAANQVWEMTPRDEYLEKVKAVLSRESSYGEWQKSGFIPIFHRVQLPQEPAGT